MQTSDLRAAAMAAVTTNPARAATAIVHDSSDARLVVFRLEPGQQVAPHTSTSTVLLVVIDGAGFVSGADGERSVRTGELIAYEPGELHGMRATDERLIILAVIAPRPGAR